MNSHRQEMKEEMKAFMQEGLRTYPPALVALSEFRRVIHSRLQSVLADYSNEFARLGLPIADLKPAGTKLDESDPGETWIGLRKNHGGELYTGYYVQWNLEEPTDQQVWVAADIYVATRADRDRLFGVLQRHSSALVVSHLEQVSDGSSCLYSYCDSGRLMISPRLFAL